MGCPRDGVSVPFHLRGIYPQIIQTGMKRARLVGALVSGEIHAPILGVYLDMQTACGRHRTVSFNTGLLVLEGVAWSSESIPQPSVVVSSEE